MSGSLTGDFKIVFVGSACVGKTSLITRYCLNQFFPQTYSTIGVSFFTKPVTLESTEVNFTIWDTAGEERFRSVAPCLLRGSDGLVIVYDLTSEQSLQDVDIYFEMFQQVVEIEDEGQPPVLLLGNKRDLTDESPELKVPDDAVRAWCSQRNVSLCEEVSAKTGENVEEAMKKLAELLVRNEKWQNKTWPAQIELSNADQGTRVCC